MALRPTILCSNCGKECRPIPPRTICQRCKLDGVKETATPTVPNVVERDVVKERVENSALPTHVLRIAAFDIETTSLNGTYGRLLCACFKFSDDDEVVTVQCRWMEEEPEALRQIKKLWDCADVVATWNGKRFDVPFINARLMHYGMEPLTHQKMHMDLMYQQRKLRFCGARLDNASKDLKANYAKYTVPGFRWPWAAQGDEEALAEIVKHCELDVLLTEEMFTKLRPLILRITK